MANDPLREPPAPKRATRNLPHTMDHDLRGVVGTRHIATIQTMRMVKDEKKEVVGKYTARLDALDLEAKALEIASGAKDGEEIHLPTPCLETPVLHEKVWQLKIERIERDSTGQEFLVFVGYEPLPSELDYLNQGTLFDDKDPDKGGGAGGGGNDALKDVPFPQEDDEEGSEGGDGEEKKPEPEAPKGKKGGKGKKK